MASAKEMNQAAAATGKDVGGLFKVKDRRHAPGATQEERLLWMAIMVPGINGRRGLPYVLEGPPGTVKSATVKLLAERAGLYFEPVIAGLREPSDFLGLPVPVRLKLTAATQHLSPDGEAEILVTNYAPSGFAARCALQERAILLIDEVKSCAPSIQNALLRLIFEGVCGDLALPPGVRMLLATNAAEDTAGGWDIGPALANRLGWLKWPEPDPGRFTEFLMAGGSSKQKETPIDSRAEEHAVDAAWPVAWARASGAVAGFIQRNSGALYRKPKSGDKKGGEAWASPRTWEMGTCALAGSVVYDLTETETHTAVAAFIGAGTTGELNTWIKNNDLPDPEAFLDGKVKFTHDKERLDRTAAVLASATSLVVRPDAPKRKERAEALWSFHKTLMDSAADVALASVQAMCRASLMIGSQSAYDVLARLEPVLSASGIVST